VGACCIVSDGGHPVPEGAVGELEIRSQTIMNGYLGQPDPGCPTRSPAMRDLVSRANDTGAAQNDPIMPKPLPLNIGRAAQLTVNAVQVVA
jgi:acyl-CoA synthetase (AMP-forming)/AMP-acid ligase II